MSVAGPIEQLYRTHIYPLPYNQPLFNGEYTGATGSGRRRLSRRQRMRGGLVTRFGAPLSGTANRNVLFGSPTGGYNAGYVPLIQAPNEIAQFRYKQGTGARKRRTRRGGGFGDLRSMPGQTRLMGQYINPQLAYYHTYPMIGSTVY